jgi:hypothetical protein
MGEAKRRKLSGDYPIISPNLPLNLRDDIAKAIGTCTLIQAGGSCITRVQLGCEVLKHLGFTPRIELGSAIYRVGPDETRDTIAFAGPYNTGCILINYGFVGHAWLRLGSDLIDLTDWHDEAMRQFDSLESLDPTETMRDISTLEMQLGRPQFSVTPLAYIWQPCAPLKAAWRPIGSPKLNELWYGPYDRRNGTPPINEPTEWVHMLLPATIQAVDDLHLVERVNEWRMVQA